MAQPTLSDVMKAIADLKTQVTASDKTTQDLVKASDLKVTDLKTQIANVQASVITAVTNALAQSVMSDADLKIITDVTAVLKSCSDALQKAVSATPK